MGMNKYDRLLIFIVSLLSFGWIGGAFQIIRLFSIVLIPFVMWDYFHNKNSTIRHIYQIGIFFLIYAAILTLIYNVGGKSYIEFTFLFINCNLVLALLLSAQKAIQPKKSLALGWLLFVAITGLIGIKELITGVHLPTNEGQIEMLDLGLGINGIKDKVYAAATFGNYNEYVTALCSALPFMFYKLLCAPSWKKIILPLSMIALSGIIIVVNASRGGILCFVVCALVYFLYYHRSAFKHKLLFAIFMAIGMPILCFKWGDLLFSQLIERMGTSNFGESGRNFLWLMGWRSFLNSYGMGLGPGAFSSEIALVPHSIILEILVLYGCVGLLLFLLVLLLILRRSKYIHGMPKMVIVSFFLMFFPYSIINSNYLQYSFFWVFLSSVIIFAINSKENEIYIVR